MLLILRSAFSENWGQNYLFFPRWMPKKLDSWWRSPISHSIQSFWHPLWHLYVEICPITLCFSIQLLNLSFIIRFVLYWDQATSVNHNQNHQQIVKIPGNLPGNAKNCTYFLLFRSKGYICIVINPSFPLSWIATQSWCHVMHSPEPSSTLLIAAILTFNI